MSDLMTAPCANCGQTWDAHLIAALLVDLGCFVSGCVLWVAPEREDAR